MGKSNFLDCPYAFLFYKNNFDTFPTLTYNKKQKLH